MEGYLNAELIKVQVAADILSVSRWTIYRLIWENVIQSVQIGRSRRIVKESLDAYIRGLIEEVA